VNGLSHANLDVEVLIPSKTFLKIDDLIIDLLIIKSKESITFFLKKIKFFKVFTALGF